MEGRLDLPSIRPTIRPQFTTPTLDNIKWIGWILGLDCQFIIQPRQCKVGWPNSRVGLPIHKFLDFIKARFRKYKTYTFVFFLFFLFQK